MAVDTVAGEEWAGHTELVTQVMDDSAQSAHEGRDLGKRVSPTLRELFVVCDPAEAVRQHFELGVAPFAVLHDLGSGAGRRFLEGLRQQSDWPLQQLVIRRQGFGTTLATLSYMDCTVSSGALRMYLADVEAVSGEQVALRRQLVRATSANLLIAPSLPAGRAEPGFAQLREDLLSSEVRGGVPLLVLPQDREVALAQRIDALVADPRLRVEVAPATQVVASAWALLAAYWNRQTRPAPAAPVQQVERISLSLKDSAFAPLAAADAASSLSLVPLSEPAPSVAPSSVAASPARPVVTRALPSGRPASLDEYLSVLVARTKATSACIFNLTTRVIQAHSPGAATEAMVEQGCALLASVGRLGQGLGVGRSVREAHVSLGEVQVIVRPARAQAGCVLMLVLPREVEASTWRQAIAELDARTTAATWPRGH